MDYDGSNGSLANYIRCNDKWQAPFQFIYGKRRQVFASEAQTCVYDIPNLSICKLVDFLKRRLDLKFHIVWHFNYHKEEVLDLLQNSPPKLVAISSTLAFYPQYLNTCVAWLNKHKKPETRIVVGGKWVYSQYKNFDLSAKLERFLVQANADYFIINRYGEETLYQLLLALKSGDPSKVRDLPNLAYRQDAVPGNHKSQLCLYDGKRYRINRVINEEQVPGRPMIDFTNIGAKFIGDIVHVRTSSSCPFHCRFCTFPHLQGKFVLFDIDDIIVQLRQLKNMGVKYLYFIDDTFNVPLKRFETLMDRMIQEKLDMQWVSFFRPQFANGDIVTKMLEAGCRMVYCGVESGNDEILKKMGKHVTLEQYHQGLDWLDRLGIIVAVSYIVGYPGETYETAMDTLRLVNDPRITFSRGGVFYYDPEAPVGKLAEEYGLTGFGAEWRHHTMDSQEAARIHLEMIDKLESINVPHSDGGGWSLFNLYCHGLNMADLKALYREFNEIQKMQIQEAGQEAFRQYRVFAPKPKQPGHAKTTYSTG